MATRVGWKAPKPKPAKEVSASEGGFVRKARTLVRIGTTQVRARRALPKGDRALVLKTLNSLPGTLAERTAVLGHISENRELVNEQLLTLAQSHKVPVAHLPSFIRSVSRSLKLIENKRDLLQGQGMHNPESIVLTVKKPEGAQAARVISENVAQVITAQRDARASQARANNLSRSVREVGNYVGPDVVQKARAGNYEATRKVINEARTQAAAGMDTSHFVTLLADRLRSREYSVAKNAVRDLGELGTPEAARFIRLALKSEDGWVRAEALRSLGRIGDEKSIKLIIDRLDAKTEEDSSVRRAAIESLGMVLGRAKPLADSDYKPGEESGVHQSRIKARELVGTSLRLLEDRFKNDPGLSVRHDAAVMIGAYGEPRHFRVLSSYVGATGVPEEVQEGAAAGWGRLRDRHYYHSEAKFGLMPIRRSKKE